MKKFKNKLRNKKVVITISLLFVVLLSGFIYVNLTNPTKINKYIAHVINKGAPANRAFDDETLYNVVVNAYNSENGTSIPYTESLTDEQLATIQSIYYMGDQKTHIESTKGIEKLVSLKSLSLTDNDIMSIDLKYNIALETLDLSNNFIKNINIKNNTELTEINIASNDLRAIDLTNNKKLINIALTYNKLDEIDLSNQLRLQGLSIGPFTDVSYNLDLSENTEIETLGLFGCNDLSVINNLNNLKTFAISYINSMNELDLSSNPELEKLYISMSNISGIDLTNNINLKEIDINGSNLVEDNIDFTNNTNLEKIEYNRTNIKKIDLLNNSNLKSLSLNDSELSEIKIPELPADASKKTLRQIVTSVRTNQTYINIGNSKTIIPASNYKYYIGKEVVIPENISVNEFINNLGLEGLTAKVFNSEISEEITEGNVADGEFVKIYDGDTVIDQLTISVLADTQFNDKVFYKAVIDAYNEANPDNTVNYNTSLTDEQLATIESLTIKLNFSLRSVDGIEKLTNLRVLDLSQCQNLTKINLSNNSLLEELDLSSTGINNLDLTNNNNLKTLRLSNVILYSFTGIDNLGDLKELNMKYTAFLTNIDYSQFPQLEILSISGSFNRNIDLSNNTELREFEAHNGTLLKNVNFGNINKLNKLKITSSKIENIDITKQTNLQDVNISDNPMLESIDLSNNTEITKLDVRDNSLTSIDLTNQNELETLYLKGNPFIMNIIINEWTSVDEPIKLSNEISNFSVGYTVSDESIATNSDGKFNALQAGITDLEATIHDSSTDEYTLSGKITVVNKVTNISLNKDSMSLDLGEEETLEATIEPENATNKNIIWTSSDESIATVDADGKVTANSEKTGVTIITATTEDGEYQATCQVTVVLPTIDVSSISLNDNSIGMNVGEKTTLTATISPDNATNNTVTWSSSDTGVINIGRISNNSAYATSSAAEILAIGPGTATITAESSNGKTATCTITVTQPVESISLDKENIVLSNKESTTLVSTINPSNATNKNITWTSSNPSVATVNGNSEISGNIASVRITAKNTGTTTITATTEDGNKVATCQVSVAETDTPTDRLPGDITGDGEIDLRDVIKLFRHYRKKAIIEDEETLAICDITGDEEIDLRDVIKLFRYYRGKIPSLD